MIAHIREQDNAVQSVKAHCRNVAELCEGYALSIDAGCIGRLQGLLHDVGKSTKAFDNYIRKESNAHRGEIDHSYAGAKYIIESADSLGNGEFYEVARLIAHTIISHHGLHDWIDIDYNDYLLLRTSKMEGYDEILEHMGDVIDEGTLSGLMKEASSEYNTIKTMIYKLSNKNKVAYSFYLGMLERFMQSCLIDADRTDTADFMSKSSTELSFDLQALWSEASKRIAKKMTVFSRREDSISIRRCDISKRCAEFAKHTVGTCRLIVPTGGGKTLSSLRFAIDYCRLHGKKKIFYVAPFMSILEQNSTEIRDIVGDDAFTEHHSNVLVEIEGGEELREYELRTEKWDTPVVATTMVQFLNALFSAKSASVRRMHRLSDAVIIIDEVQSIPLRCVNIFNLAINFLTKICGSTVVLCSATQPAMDKTEFPMLLDKDDSMTGDYTTDFDAFHRTTLISDITPYGFDYDEAAEYCAKRFDENGNLLVVVNTKSAAKEIYLRLSERLCHNKVIHLSTNLCPKHRKERIEEMKMLLATDEPVICVTTQLIEAGVDISFRCVVRSWAGLDNAAQAAGRCNRNGESDSPCPVYIIKLKNENISKLEGIRTAQIVSQQIFDSGVFSDYLSNKTQNEYFKRIYDMEKGKLSYPVPRDHGETLINLLSLNKHNFSLTRMDKRKEIFTSQAFKTAGTIFEVIDKQSMDIIVPYDEEAMEIMEALDCENAPERDRELLRKAQMYTVNMYASQRRKLSEVNALRRLQSGAYALEKEFYDENLGLTTEGSNREILMF